MRKLVIGLVALLCAASIAWAGSTTLNYTNPGSGSTIRFTTDGSSNNIPNNTIWDSAAGANGLAITTNNAAKMEGVGTAGTAAGGILTVQGVASMTPFLANPGTAANWGIFAQGSATSGQVGEMIMGAVTTGAPSYTTAQTSPLSLDTAGNLRASVLASALPTGAATSALQTTGNTALTTINTTLGTPIQATGGTVGIVAGSAAIGTVTQTPNVTPTDCSSTITAGGTAQNAFTAQTTLHGFTIQNMDATVSGGEPLCISFTGTASCGAAGTFTLAPEVLASNVPPGSWTTPPGAAFNHAVSVIAATTGHVFSCTRW